MERVQKILARAGFGSRRACEELIVAGRVMINGEKAILGSKADPTQDKILVHLRSDLQTQGGDLGSIFN
jgi:23S rRNA pseudouridine2605 synthase